jgi:hypothetical protein
MRSAVETARAMLVAYRDTNASRLDNRLIQKHFFVGLTDAERAGA